MSERGKVLAVFTLLIGICGIGLGIYAIFFQPQQPSVISNIWTVEQGSTYYPGGTYSDMPNMNVIITVNAGETIYVTFNAQYNLGVAGTWLKGGARVMRDGIAISESLRQFSIEVSVGSVIWYSLSTQFLITGLEAGTYELNVQVMAYSGSGTPNIGSGVLLTYTYR